MSRTRHVSDYQPVSPSGPRAASAGDAEVIDWPAPRPRSFDDGDGGGGNDRRDGGGDDNPSAPPALLAPAPAPARAALKRGHALSYAGLFAFTFVLYFRPYELFPSLSSLTSLAFYCAAFTLACFVPTQLALEGNFTARLREVYLAALLCLAALVSMPLAASAADSWAEFTGTFIKAVLIFVVMVNVVRTERRLVWLLLLAIAISCLLGWNAVSDYRAGRLVVSGTRIEGAVGGMFGNPNDMALHLVTIMPVAVALFFRSRNPLTKLAYAAAAALMVAGVVVSFSRGGFLGLLGAVGVLAWKLGRRHRLSVVLAVTLGGAAFFALAPGDYGGRLRTIFNTSSDTTGSASSRRELLIISLKTTAANPVFGIGMGNFYQVGYHNQVSHNAYTQVSAEMGLFALAVYVLFIWSPFKALRRIERETEGDRRRSRFYHLSVGVQAALVGYMISSFFGSVAYQFYVYYLVGYAVCLRRLYEAAAATPARAAEPPTTVETYAG